jgi:hypothetical protein
MRNCQFSWAIYISLYLPNSIPHIHPPHFNLALLCPLSRPQSPVPSLVPPRCPPPSSAPQSRPLPTNLCPPLLPYRLPLAVISSGLCWLLPAAAAAAKCSRLLKL